MIKIKNVETKDVDNSLFEVTFNISRFFKSTSIQLVNWFAKINIDI